MELTYVLTGYWDLYIVTENLGSFDNMACACDTHPSAFTKQKLGWLDSSAVATHTGQAHSYDLHTLGLVQAEALPLPHPFCRFCAWCISCGNAPCAKPAKNLSGRRRRPCSGTV